MLQVSEGYDDQQVHVSIFPRDVRADWWNVAFNEEEQYRDRNGAIAEANSQQGDIGDLETMEYDEFHVTFGHGTKSDAHYFYDLKGRCTKAPASDERQQAFADRVARSFLRVD